DAVTRPFVDAARPGDAFEIEGRIVSGTSTFARFRIPAIAGRRATIWSGIESAYLHTWAVDVANLTQFGVPIVAWCLDGFALEFLVEPETLDVQRVALHGVVRMNEGAFTVLPTGNPDTPTIERVKSRSLFLDTTIRTSAGETAPSIAIGGTSLALEWRLVRR